jgi:hypothetical protein
LRPIAIVIVLAVGSALALWAAPAQKPKTSSSAKKKTTTKAASSKSAKATGSSKTTGKKTTAAKKTTPAKQTASRFRRSSQREPDSSRYIEIQQSLATKGYFAGSVNGAWGADSVEALKRFQRDQNIGDDGKLGSLSLIALGLGPKRGASDAENPAGALPPP